MDALWLSPFFRSPMADFGYDVSDYCDVDPLFGTLADFDALLEEAHALGLKVIIDWVPNHTSDQHPWFVDAVSGRSSHRRHWYVWRDPGPDGGPPNNWVAAFDLSAPAWTFDPASGQWYLHLFESAQPDLNWDEPGVVDAMHDVLRFWLDRGVDGFRADVVHCIGKDPALPDNPPDVAAIPHSRPQRRPGDPPTPPGYPGPGRRLPRGPGGGGRGLPAVHRGHRHLLRPRRRAAPGLQLPAAVRTDGSRVLVADASTDTAEAFDPRGAWPTWVLSNHDNPRHRTRYDRAAAFRGEDPSTTSRRSEARARAAAVLLLTLRGTPVPVPG